MPSQSIVIEDWNGDGAIRIPDSTLQEMGVDVGDVLYLIEADAANQTMVLSRTPKVRDRLDELVDHLDSLNHNANLQRRD